MSASELASDMAASEIGTGSRGRDIAASLASLVGGDLVNRALRFGATIILARALTLDEFGVLNTAIAVTGLVVVVATVGLVDFGTREVALRANEVSQLAHRVFAIRLSALALASGSALVVLIMLGERSWALLAAAVAMAVCMTLACDWILRGLEQMRVLAFAWSAGGAAVVIGALLVAWRSGSAAGALWAYAAGEAVIALVGWTVLRKMLRPGLSAEHWRPLIRAAWPLAISTVVIYAYTANLDTIILTATRSVGEAGLYSAPYRVFWVLSAVVVFASYSALPRFSRQSVDGREGSVRDGVVLLGRVLGCYALAIIAAGELLGEWGLSFVFGGKFGSMGGVFVALSAGLAWYAVGFPAGQSLIASNDNRGFLYGAAVAGVANVTGNLIAIPLYGPIGAAWATTASFAVGSLVWLRRRGLRRSDTSWLVGVAAFATASAVIASTLAEETWTVGLATMLAAAGGILGNIHRVREVW